MKTWNEIGITVLVIPRSQKSLIPPTQKNTLGASGEKIPQRIRIFVNWCLSPGTVNSLEIWYFLWLRKTSSIAITSSEVTKWKNRTSKSDSGNGQDGHTRLRTMEKTWELAKKIRNSHEKKCSVLPLYCLGKDNFLLVVRLRKRRKLRGKIHSHLQNSKEVILKLKKGSDL